MSSMIKSKQKTILLIMMMLLAQAVVLIPSVTANISTDSTLRTTFSNDDNFVIIQFDSFGNQIQPGASLEIPRNSTVEALNLGLTYNSSNSPGNIWLDMNEDGTPEYGYNGTGYGHLGNQTRFSDDSIINFSSNSAGNWPGPEFILPQDINLEDSLLSVDFIPDNSGRWMLESSIIDITTLNYDNDSLDEIMVLSSSWDTGNGDLLPAIGWINNNSNNDGVTNISWHQTCNNVQHLEITDFDGDGHDDVLVWTPQNGRFCYHLWSPAQNSFSAPQELTGGSSGQEIFVKAADVDLDGFGDIVYADAMGSYGLYQWKQSIPGFEFIDEWAYETMIGGVYQQTGISQFDIGNIMQGNDNATLVFISDQLTADTLAWNPGSNEFTAVFSSFNNVDISFLWLEDLNEDTFDDIITWGQGTSGELLISDDMSGTYVSSTQSGLEAPENAIMIDYDSDGVQDILIPENATADNDDNTMNGSLMVYNFVGGTFTNSNRNLTPRTMPTLTTFGDINGDQNPEIIAYCGEQNNGIFIDSWHKMNFDFDSDGIIELSAEGFAQADSGANGSQLIRAADSTGSISNTIELNQQTYPTFTDAYGNDMMTISSIIDISTAGSVVFQNLRITYQWSHHLEDFYDGSGHNLTTYVNSEAMEFGTGNFTLPLLFSSTNAGEFNVDNLYLVTTPGHPDLPDLEPLYLQAIDVQEDLVELRWSEVITGSQYFSSYELYRSTAVNATFPGDYNLLINKSGDHTDVTYIDSGLVEGGHYEYVVKAIFSVGGLESMLSNVISVDLPAIPRVENVVAIDTPMDQGGSIDITWDEVDDRYTGFYDVFVSTQNFTDTTLMDSVYTLSHTETSHSAIYTSAIRDDDGNILVPSATINNEQALWVAVVATNDSGSNPFVTALGPVYALNNNELTTELTMELSSAIIFGNSIDDENLIVGGNEPTIISLSLLSDTGSPIEDANIMTTVIVDPDGEAYEFFFNSTTDNTGAANVQFNWIDLASESISVNGGVMEIMAHYDGREETLEKGPLGSSDVELKDIDIVVPAYFSLITTVVMVDEFGDTNIEVSLIAEHDWQQAAFLGTEVTFKYYKNDGSLTSTTKQSIMDLDGNLDVFIDAMPEGGYVLITPDNSANPNNPAAWKYLNNFELNATLVEYDDSGQANLDDDGDFVLNDDDLCPNTPGNEVGQVDSDGCAPSQLGDQIDIIDLTLECPTIEWLIENVANSQNSNRECELINSNDLFITIEHPDKVSVGGIDMGINCPSFVGANAQVTCTFSPTVLTETNKDTNDPVLTNFNTEFTFTWLTPTGTNQMKDITYSVEFWLNGSITEVVNDNTGNDNSGNNDNTDNNDNGDNDNTGGGTEPVINEESADTKAGILEDPLMLGLIGGGALIALISIVIIVRFFRGDDDDWDDDWEDDDEDEDMENPLDRILGRSGGQSYGGAPVSQEPFERETNRGRLSGSAGEEFVRQSQQSNDYEDDPGYSVDEDGTEWWEDENGQWWYRDPNMDDWEEWNE